MKANADLGQIKNQEQLFLFYDVSLAYPINKIDPKTTNIYKEYNGFSPDKVL